MKLLNQIILSFLVLVSVFNNISAQENDLARQVTIAGKVRNHDINLKLIEITVNRPGLGPLQLKTTIDDEGKFSESFQAYLPTDAWLFYKTNFLILIHPGDSIYVEFDGSKNDRPELLNSIKLGGSNSRDNEDAAAFQKIYFSNPLYSDWDAKQKAKMKDAEDYVIYLDSVNTLREDELNHFVSEYKPSDKVALWASTLIQMDYYYDLAYYPDEHISLMNLNRSEWSVPDGYFDGFQNPLPLTEEMLISGYSISHFVNTYHYYYARKKLMAAEENKKFLINSMFAAPTSIYDSLIVYGIMKYTPDDLLRQLVLTELFRQSLNKSEIALYEKYHQLVASEITNPGLREPLEQKYSEVKKSVDNPKLSSDAMLMKVSSTSAGAIMDSIISVNSGKVIYVDFWATWCGPCLSEMPNSKRLMEQLDEKEVAFVYLCLDSKEGLWKATLSKHQMTGQQYFLDKQQSDDIRASLKINGIPHYFLIDKGGIIIDNGSHLRPDVVEDKIQELLKG